MDCAKARLRIVPYVAGEISPEERGPLEAHFASCDECRLDLDLSRAATNAPSHESEALTVEPMAPSSPDGGEEASSQRWTLDSIFGPSDVGEGPAGPGVVTPEAVSEESFEPVAGSQGPIPERAPVTEPAPPPQPLQAPERPPVPSPKVSPAPPVPQAAPAQAAAVPASAAPQAEAAPAPPRAAPAPPRAAPAPPRAAPGPARPQAPKPPPKPPPAPEPTEVFEPAAISEAAIGRAPDGAEEPPRTHAASRGLDSAEKEPAAPSWDFEPADSRANVKPPEGSLFFAQEALTRPGSRRKRGFSFLRFVLWSLGGIMGLLLLAFSAWVAMTLRPSGPSPGTGLPDSTATASADSAAASDEPPVVGGVAPTPIAPVPIPTGASGAPAVPEAIHTPPAGQTPPGQTPPASAPTAPSTAASAPPAAAQTLAAGQRPAPPVPSRATPPRPAPVEDDDDEFFDDDPLPLPPTKTVRRETVTPRETTQVTRVEPSPSAPAQGSTGTAEAQPPATDPVQRPIDRIHLATLQAEENADLDALRKLRDTWKGFVKSSVGPDRARAKRELADCLWAIQTLTGKTSDQKVALLAYRDYLLNAPAGGADSRTVSRMRQLEDALAESR